MLSAAWTENIAESDEITVSINSFFIFFPFAAERLDARDRQPCQHLHIGCRGGVLPEPVILHAQAAGGLHGEAANPMTHDNIEIRQGLTIC
jgi:hypothetical protein